MIRTNDPCNKPIFIYCRVMLNSHCDFVFFYPRFKYINLEAHQRLEVMPTVRMHFFPFLSFREILTPMDNIFEYFSEFP